LLLVALLAFLLTGSAGVEPFSSGVAGVRGEAFALFVFGTAMFVLRRSGLRCCGDRLNRENKKPPV
jgi:hypothetical protein